MTVVKGKTYSVESLMPSHQPDIAFIAPDHKLYY